MKKITILLITIALIAGSASLAVAGSEKGVAVREGKSTGTFEVYYAADNAGMVTLHIYNEEHTRLYTQRVKSEYGFMLPVNLSNMPYGEYLIEIVDGNQRQTQVFNYAPIPSGTYVNVHRVANSKQFALTLSKVQKGTSVNIYDQAANLLYREVIKEDGDFAKLYDLQKVAGTAVSIEVRERGQTLERKSIQF